MLKVNSLAYHPLAEMWCSWHNLTTGKNPFALPQSLVRFAVT
jgi:hypothetical protein